MNNNFVTGRNLRVQLVPSPWKSWLQVQVKLLAVGAHVAAEWQLLYSGAHKPGGEKYHLYVYCTSMLFSEILLMHK